MEKEDLIWVVEIFMNKTKVNLGIIQETLLIPLWARACELKAADPIIVDPKSSEVIAAIDYEFDKFTTAKFYQIGCCLHLPDVMVLRRQFFEETERRHLIAASA